MNFDKNELRREQDLRRHWLWDRARVGVRKASADLRDARTATEIHQWHRQLFASFLDVQAYANRARDHKAQLRRLLRPPAHLSQDERAAVGERLRRADLDRRVAVAALAVLRDLGDALVWRLVEHQRGAITAMGHGVRVDRLPEGRGLDAEIKEMDRLWRQRRVLSVHTDLTNSVRHGDLLSVERWEPRELCLIEVKAAARQGRTDRSRQMRALEELTLVLNGDWHSIDRRSVPTPRQCPVEVRTHQSQLKSLLDEARTGTYAWTELEPGFCLVALDERDPARLGAAGLDAARRHHLSVQGWGSLGSDGPEELSGSSVHRVCSDRRHSFPGQVPLALFPLDPRTISEVVCGPLVYWTCIRADAIEERFAQRGIRAVVARGRSAADGFMVIRQGAQTVSIPAPTRSQLLHELFTIDTIVDTGEWMLNDMAGSGIQRTFTLNYPNESSIWRPMDGPGEIGR